MQPQRKTTPQQPTVPTLTVGELAAMAGTSDVPTTIERIRHWTREGLLQVAGNLHEGTGRHRRYHRDAPYDVAFLDALARAGVSVATLRYAVDALSVARISLAEWKVARAKGRPPAMQLEILFIDTGVTVTHVHKGLARRKVLAEIRRKRPGILTENAFAALSISLDLGGIFEKVWRLSAELEASESPTAEA
jgi:DNA-binding transcriptional MerR regulator